MSKLKGKSWKRKTQHARNLRARSSPIPHGVSILASAIIFLQLNDVYFIDARADYSRDDGLLLPRVAIVIKRLRKRFPVVVCIPGDFLAPSCMSKLFHGKQMISVLNHVGVDYATFGNHEFEEFITPPELARLMRKSKFKWLSANFTTDHPALEDSFTPLDAQRFTEHVRVFITGVTYQKHFKGFGEALDPILAAGSTTDLYRETLVEMIADGEQPEQDTFYVALTRQRIAEDRKFAQELPHFQLIMGGHDHDQLYSDWQRQSIIVKAVSNARSIRLNCLLLLNPQDVDPLRDLSCATLLRARVSPCYHRLRRVLAVPTDSGASPNGAPAVQSALAMWTATPPSGGPKCGAWETVRFPAATNAVGPPRGRFVAARPAAPRRDTTDEGS